MNFKIIWLCNMINNMKITVLTYIFVIKWIWLLKCPSCSLSCMSPKS